MKRISAMILSTAMVLSVCACGGGTKTAETTIAAEENTTAAVPKKEGHWQVEMSTDDFGDVTDESIPMLLGKFDGDFSNTATSSSELKVEVLNVDDNFGFYLYEYGKTKASFLSSDDKLLKIKIANDITEEKLIEFGDGALYCGGVTGTLIKQSLNAGSDVRCIIEVGSSKYNFTMNGDNYEDSISEREGIIDNIYSEAASLFEQGEYEKALKKFDVIKDYRSATKYTDSLFCLPKRIEYKDGRAREYKYDSDGNVVTYIQTMDDGSKNTYNYEYSDGKLSSITYPRHTIVFSDNGASSEETIEVKAGNAVFINHYTYDDNGMIKEIVREKGPNQEMAFKAGRTDYSYEYDDNGFITAVELNEILNYDNEDPKIAKQTLNIRTQFNYDNGVLCSVDFHNMNWKVVDVEYIYPRENKNYNNLIQLFTWIY